MEAAAVKICSRCGRQGLAEATCPDCGAPTYTPGGAAPATATAANPSSGLMLSLVGAAAVIGSLFATWYTLTFPAQLRGFLGTFGGQLGESFERLVPGSSAEINRGLDDVLRDGIAVDGWQAFELADIGLAVAAALCIVLVGVLIVYGRAVERSIADVRRVVTGLGGFVIGVTVFRMVDQPNPGEFFDLGIGPWIALAGGAAMVLGGGLSTNVRVR